MLVICMTKDRTTKNTYRFASDDPDAAITMVYVKKSSIAVDVEKITLRLEAVSNKKGDE